MRRIAAETGIDPATVSGTGRGDRVTKEDMLKAQSAPASAPTGKSVATTSAAAGTAISLSGEGRAEQRVPMTRLRQRIAERMMQSKNSIAMLTSFNEINMKPVIDIRKKYADTFQQVHGIKLGFMSFFVKACTEALKLHPIINASVDGNDVVYHAYQDIGVAVATPKGLVVPVLRNTDSLGLADIEKAIGNFAKQARGPFIIMLVTGGLVGAVDAGLYWSVGWLIDLLDRSDPAALIGENWPQLLALFALVVAVRAAVIVGAAVMEQQVIAPRFYALVRWQAFRRVIEQPYTFYQNDFAGRIATKVMQGGEATGEFIISVLQTLWAFLTFVVLTTTILATLDARMVAVLAVWAAGYVLIARFLLPPLRIAGRRRANERSVLNGRMVDAFTNIISVKLFDSGRREHGFVREGMQRLLDANVTLARLITSVRAAVALLNGAMMAAIGFIAISSWMAGDVTSGAIAAALGLVLRLNQMSGWMMFNINGLIRQYATIQDAIGTISVEPALADRPARTPRRP